MTPQAILLIVQGIQAAIAAAPQVIEVATKAKEFVTALFTAGVITKAQQDAIHARVDAECAMVAAGIIDPAWTVEPDPA